MSGNYAEVEMIYCHRIYRNFLYYNEFLIKITM